MVMVTITLAGVWYGWLRLSSGSIWPVCLSHSVFNNVMESLAGVAIVTSAATMAYVTTETGVATMVIMVLVAAFLLVRKAADFDKARPELSARRWSRALRQDTGMMSSPARPPSVVRLHQLATYFGRTVAISRAGCLGLTIGSLRVRRLDDRSSVLFTWLVALGVVVRCRRARLVFPPRVKVATAR